MIDAQGQQAFAIRSFHPVPSDSPANQTLEDELLLLLARQGRRVPIPVFLTDSLLAWMVAQQLAVDWPIFIWLVMVAIVLVTRWKVLTALPDRRDLTTPQKLRIAAALSALNGVIHGLATFTFPVIGELERAFLSILLLGLCAGSVATTAGHRVVFLGFVLPTIVPLAVAWALTAPIAEHQFTSYSIAGLILVFGGLLIALAKDSYELFSESFAIRLQQSEMNHRLQLALKSAEAANSAKTRFLAAASHDLRQPMHTLTLFAAALSMRSLPGESQKIAEQISMATQSLGSQLDVLLDISKLDAGIVKPSLSNLSLRSLLRLIERECQPIAKKKALSLRVECPEGVICQADEILLARIVRNLIDNAIKYTQTGSIHLHAAPCDGHCRLVIEDTGIGITAEEQLKVFEEFYQVDNPERDRTRGLGLGLSIVRRLCDLLSIGLEMDSIPGVGTRVTLSIPAGNSPSAVVGQLEQVEQALPDFQGVCVLVLDDEESVRMGMQALLKNLGAQVLLSGSLEEAHQRCRERRPDILLADMRLRGGESGIEACQDLERAYPGLPALLITGDIAPERLRLANLAGIRTLHKPVLPGVLRRAIEAELARKGNDDRTRRRPVP